MSAGRPPGYRSVMPYVTALGGKRKRAARSHLLSSLLPHRIDDHRQAEHRQENADDDQCVHRFPAFSRAYSAAVALTMAAMRASLVGLIFRSGRAELNQPAFVHRERLSEI